MGVTEHETMFCACFGAAFQETAAQLVGLFAENFKRYVGDASEEILAADPQI